MVGVGSDGVRGSGYQSIESVGLPAERYDRVSFPTSTGQGRENKPQ